MSEHTATTTTYQPHLTLRHVRELRPHLRDHLRATFDSTCGPLDAALETHASSAFGLRAWTHPGRLAVYLHHAFLTDYLPTAAAPERACLEATLRTLLATPPPELFVARPVRAHTFSDGSPGTRADVASVHVEVVPGLRTRFLFPDGVAVAERVAALDALWVQLRNLAAGGTSPFIAEMQACGERPRCVATFDLLTRNWRFGDLAFTREVYATTGGQRQWGAVE